MRGGRWKVSIAQLIALFAVGAGVHAFFPGSAAAMGDAGTGAGSICFEREAGVFETETGETCEPTGEGGERIVIVDPYTDPPCGDPGNCLAGAGAGGPQSASGSEYATPAEPKGHGQPKSAKRKPTPEQLVCHALLTAARLNDENWPALARSRVAVLYARLEVLQRKWEEQRGLDLWEHSEAWNIGREISALRGEIRRVLKARKAYAGKDCDDVLFGDIVH
jgi:hypothetical protein